MHGAARRQIGVSLLMLLLQVNDRFQVVVGFCPQESSN